jgi:hypothetical protein
MEVTAVLRYVLVIILAEAIFYVLIFRSLQAGIYANRRIFMYGPSVDGREAYPPDFTCRLDRDVSVVLTSLRMVKDQCCDFKSTPLT